MKAVQNNTIKVIGYEESYALSEKNGSVKKKLNARTLIIDEIRQNQRFEIRSESTSTPKI